MRRAGRLLVSVFLASVLVVVPADSALAGGVYLGAGGSVTINGAAYEAIDPTADLFNQSVFSPFVSLVGGSVIEGYNTDYRPTQFDENDTAAATRSILLSDVPQILASTALHRVFRLEIDQDMSASSYLTLDTVEIYESLFSDLCGYPFDGSNSSGHVDCTTNNTATLIYDMDAGENSYIVLEDNGSGITQDLELLVPDSLFSQDPNCDWKGVGCTTFVHLYSQFGGDIEPLHPNNGGPEQWGVIDLPATNTAPVVDSVAATDVGSAQTGETSYSFSVTYSDDFEVWVFGLDTDDVTVTGPGGALTVTGVSEPTGTDGSPRTATYTVIPPGGSWDSEDNGTYTIGVVGSEVWDIFGESVVADASLATFNVNAETEPVPLDGTYEGTSVIKTSIPLLGNNKIETWQTVPTFSGGLFLIELPPPLPSGSNPYLPGEVALIRSGQNSALYGLSHDHLLYQLELWIIAELQSQLGLETEVMDRPVKLFHGEVRVMEGDGLRSIKLKLLFEYDVYLLTGEELGKASIEVKFEGITY